MRLFIVSVVLAAFLGVNAHAQESKPITGYLVDKMCGSGMVKKGPAEAMLKASKHTRECALEPGCAESGYGLVSDGKYIKFDAKGDEKAKAFLEKTKLTDHIMVEVSGSVQGETFAVTSLKEAKMQSKKPMKKT